MVIIPKILVKSGEAIGNEIFIGFPDLDTNFTFLTTNYAAGITTFAVENGLKFSDTNYIVTNTIGNEKCEISKISGTPTASSINLVSASIYAHNRGEQIRFIPFNQVEIYSSTDNINFTLLTTINIRPDADNTFYNDTIGTATTYYKARFKNSTLTTYSLYSDVIIATGYIANSVGNLIQNVLTDLGEKIDGVRLTKRVLFNALNEGRREIDENEGIIRWSFRSVFNYKLYSIIPGQYKVPVPTDLRDPNTNQNILGLRVGKSKYFCHYIDQRTFDNLYMNIGHTTLNGVVATGDPTITLTNSGDFNDSSDIDIAAETVGETIDTISYTANDLTTNIISGVTGIRATGHSTGIDVWQGVSYGLPLFYTVIDGYIYFSQPFANDFAGESVFIDYYKLITDINSDADLLDEPFYNIYIPYLRFKIKMIRDKSLDWKNDVDFIKWESHKKSQVAKQYFGQDISILIG